MQWTSLKSFQRSGKKRRQNIKSQILCYLFQNVLPLKLSSFNRDRLNPVYLEDLNASRRIQVKNWKLRLGMWIKIHKCLFSIWKNDNNDNDNDRTKFSCNSDECTERSQNSTKIVCFLRIFVYSHRSYTFGVRTQPPAFWSIRTALWS